MLLLATRLGLDEVPLKVKLPTGVSASPMVMRNGPTGISVNVLRAGIAAMVGGELPTVRTKGSLALLTPSLTVTVIVDAPVCPDAGVTVTVRLAPLPPKTIFAVGTKVGFDEV